MSGIERVWNSRGLPSRLLWPLSLLFGAAVWVRRKAYRVGVFRSRRFPVPVIVVGNISVGGTGKTPLVIWLAGHLRQQGLRPGIVSRGYGGRARHWPQQVRADSDAAVVGDEAVMLAARTGCPTCVGPDRPAAVAALMEHTGINVVISDDGLQHYALARDLEIAVVDGERRFGNGFLLPAGPLREPAKRLLKTDLVIVNGGARHDELSMNLFQPVLRSLDGRRQMAMQNLKGNTVHAVAGIGNPERFFGLLRRLGLAIITHAFPDHHPFRAADLAFEDGNPVLMTEKDAVKCRRLPCLDCWVVQVDAQPDAAFVHQLDQALEEIIDGQETARHPGMSDLQE